MYREIEKDTQNGIKYRTKSQTVLCSFYERVYLALFYPKYILYTFLLV